MTHYRAVHSLPAPAFKPVDWHENSNEMLSGVSLLVRVRLRVQYLMERLRPSSDCLSSGPQEDADPIECYLSNLPDDTALEQPVAQAPCADALNVTIRT